jgi:hypothetical protein
MPVVAPSGARRSMAEQAFISGDKLGEPLADVIAPPGRRIDRARLRRLICQRRCDRNCSGKNQPSCVCRKMDHGQVA